MKKILKALLSIILATLMVFYTIPVSAFEKEDSLDEIINENQQIIDDSLNNDLIDDSEKHILYEIIEKREANVKHFKLSDGSNTAVIYGSAVHYKDKSGKWTEYDNKLTLKDGMYQSSNNGISIKFAEKSDSDYLLKIEDNRYGISMNLLDKKGCNNGIVDNPNVSIKGIQISLDEINDNKDKESTIKYNNILDDIDIEYVLSGPAIKENIIINSKQNNYKYDFELILNGLVPELLENGSINLSDMDTGEVIYTIPAGYMYDANGEMSFGVTYSIIEKKNGVYCLSVSADEEWINDGDRAFPVVVDPTVTINSGNFDYVFYDSANVNTNYTTHPIGIGYFSSDGSIEARAVFRVPQLPNIDINNNKIIDAEFYLYRESTSGYSPTLAVHKITSSLSSLTNVKWNNHPSFNASASSYVKIPCVVDYNKFNVRDIVESWYTTSNNGLLIKPGAESPGYAIFGRFEPLYTTLCIYYIEIDEYKKEGSWQDYGSFGYTSVMANPYNGGMRLVQGDVSSSTNVLPLTISHYYNIYNYDAQYNSLMRFGKGWTLNIFESVPTKTELINYYNQNGEYLVIYKDAFGDERKYSGFVEPSILYPTHEGDSSKFIIDLDGDYLIYNDGYGNKKWFDINGNITCIEDSKGNKINYGS